MAEETKEAVSLQFPIGLKLEAKNGTEQKVLDYLTANASATLTGKINDGKKTLKGALQYAKDEAKKLAKNEGYIMVEDDTVYGWIIHFFEDDSIEEKKSRGTKKAGKQEPVAKPKAKDKEEKVHKPSDDSLTMDLFGDRKDPF